MPIVRPYRAEIPEYPYVGEFEQEELKLNSKQLARTEVAKLFQRFGFDVADQTLQALQAELFKKN